ncbi:MAG: zf-TFIIB domain-containing protein [Spirochaetales bacterium]|nr:zf-TFIIB domain-containing protein [Spirochaetales bacterium]
MNCQICQGLITPMKKGDTELLKCKGCDGFWIKRGALNRLIKHKAGDLEFSSIDHHMHHDTHGIMKCVFCEDQAMIKINFINESRIILDYCEECGAFWIDNGEVEKMQNYVDKIEANNEKTTILEVIFKTLLNLPKI